MDKEFLTEAVEESKANEENNFTAGGPFGAIVVKDGKIVGRGHNLVLANHDPTAHAEINAIRDAGKRLKTHDLEGCVLYVNAEPCPMCLSAIIWANIKEVYYANTAKDAAKIGFRDDFIYEFIKSGSTDNNVLNIKRYNMNEAKEVFKDFKDNPNKTMY